MELITDIWLIIFLIFFVLFVINKVGNLIQKTKFEDNERSEEIRRKEYLARNKAFMQKTICYFGKEK